MNLPSTSKEEIISICQRLAKEKGLSSINMRSVAIECSVSVGAIYNYFPSKSELLCSTIESIWKDIFHMTWLFESIQEGSQEYPEFLSKHAMSLAAEDKVVGQKMMKKYFFHLKQNLLIVLKKDQKIRKDAFNQKLDQTLFIEYIFELFIFSIVNPQQNYQGIIELVERYLY